MRPMATFGVCIASACNTSPSPTTNVTVSAAATAAAVPPATTASSESKVLRMTKYGTLAEAIEEAKPLMSDEFNKTSDGALLFALWAVQKMAWVDAAPPKDETTIALVMKDPDEARGKRLCAPGSLIEIQIQKTELGKMFEGLLRTGAYNIVRFIAVGSTGSLVKSSPARFCGVVIGKWDYTNSGGGTGHAVQVVGMFDLPENKKVAVTGVATAAPRPVKDDKLLKEMLEPRELKTRITNPEPLPVSTGQP